MPDENGRTSFATERELAITRCALSFLTYVLLGGEPPRITHERLTLDAKSCLEEFLLDVRYTRVFVETLGARSRLVHLHHLTEEARGEEHKAVMRHIPLLRFVIEGGDEPVLLPSDDRAIEIVNSVLLDHPDWLENDGVNIKLRWMRLRELARQRDRTI